MTKYWKTASAIGVLAVLGAIGIAFSPRPVAAQYASGTSTSGSAPVTVVNTPLPVTGTVNVGNTVQTQAALPPGAFSVEAASVRSRVLSGPDPEGTNYAITSFTVANEGATAKRVRLEASYGTTSDCSSFSGIPTTVGGPIVMVPPGATVHLSFPQPYVIRARTGFACLNAILITGSEIVDTTVVGYRF